jgi:hypothetical protein
MNKKPLSISAYQTYVECPAKFKLHYQDRIRPVTQMSYFIFGSAVDKMLNALLTGEGTPLFRLVKEMQRLLSEEVEYLATDYDGELLSSEQKLKLIKKCRKYGYKGDDIDSLVAGLISKPFADLSTNQKKALSLCCHRSLTMKAVLMLDAYRAKVLPKLSNIGNVQKEYKWKDAAGNEFIGIIDFTATLNGWDITGDNKTAGNPERDYTQDSVRTSIQFSAYQPQTGKSHAAYFVMSKMMRKNRVKTCSICDNDGTGKRHKTCEAVLTDETGATFGRCNGEWIETVRPEADVLIRVDEVPREEQAIVQKAMSGVAEAVKCGSFPENLKSCKKQYGPKTVYCPYYNYCRGGSMDGLEVKKEDPKK